MYSLQNDSADHGSCAVADAGPYLPSRKRRFDTDIQDQQAQAVLRKLVRTLPELQFSEPGDETTRQTFALTPGDGADAARPPDEDMAQTAILILMVMVAHGAPVTHEHIRCELPRWAHAKGRAIDQLVNAGLIQLRPFRRSQRAEFVTTERGRALALHAAYRLLLTMASNSR